MSGKKQTCNIDVNLINYDGEEIDYWFYIKDRAGNLVMSKTRTLTVDMTFPEINNLTAQAEGNKAHFIINITEENLDDVQYIDNSASRPRFKKLCTKLKEGICEKKITLSDGEHNIDIQVADKAGNIISQNVIINIV